MAWRGSYKKFMNLPKNLPGTILDNIFENTIIFSNV